MTLSLFLRIDFFLPPVPRHLPDDTLGSELAVKFWINAFTAVIDIEALTTLLTEPCSMFLANRNRFSIRMISALHLFIPNETSHPFRLP